MLEEAALKDVTPPAFHIGCHTLSKALLVSGFLKLSVEDIDNIEGVGRDEINFRVTEFIAYINVVLLEDRYSGLHASMSMFSDSVLVKNALK